MINKNYKVAGVLLLLINIALVATLSVKLYNTNSLLSETMIRLDNAIAFPTVAAQPRIPVKITYTGQNGKTTHISAYDDCIDVGNEKVNEALMFAILSKRAHELVSSEIPLEVEVIEDGDHVRVKVYWVETVKVFSVPLS